MLAFSKLSDPLVAHVQGRFQPQQLQGTFRGEDVMCVKMADGDLRLETYENQ